MFMYFVVNKEKNRLMFYYYLGSHDGYSLSYLSIVKLFYSRCLTQQGHRRRRKARKDKNVLGRTISDRIYPSTIFRSYGAGMDLQDYFILNILEEKV